MNRHERIHKVRPFAKFSSCKCRSPKTRKLSISQILMIGVISATITFKKAKFWKVSYRNHKYHKELHLQISNPMVIYILEPLLALCIRGFQCILDLQYKLICIGAPMQTSSTSCSQYWPVSWLDQYWEQLVLEIHIGAPIQTGSYWRSNIYWRSPVKSPIQAPIE